MSLALKAPARQTGGVEGKGRLMRHTRLRPVHPPTSDCARLCPGSGAGVGLRFLRAAPDAVRMFTPLRQRGGTVVRDTKAAECSAPM